MVCRGEDKELGNVCIRHRLKIPKRYRVIACQALQVNACDVKIDFETGGPVPLPRPARRLLVATAYARGRVLLSVKHARVLADLRSCPVLPCPALACQPCQPAPSALPGHPLPINSPIRDITQNRPTSQHVHAATSTKPSEALQRQESIICQTVRHASSR